MVAWLVSHWAVATGLLVAVPSLEELHGGSRAWAGAQRPWAGDILSLRCGRAAFSAEHRAELAGPEALEEERTWGSGAPWGATGEQLEEHPEVPPRGRHSPPTATRRATAAGGYARHGEQALAGAPSPAYGAA